MRSTVVISSTRESSRAAHAGQTCRRKPEKMKLPISLLVLVALSQALSGEPLTKRSEANSSVVEIPIGESLPAKGSSSKSSLAKSPVAKSSAAKSSAAKQKDETQTSKRELYEGNFGERNQEVVPKYEVTGPTPKIEYANELQDMISEQSPTDQTFGLRLPPAISIAKISDVLSGHGPSFEAALAKHLYSPVSVYQARLSSPTSFEVPSPAASQSPYSNPKAYKLQADAENEQKLQEAPPKGVELPSPVLAVYMVNQPRHQFEAYPQPLNSGLNRQHANLPQEIFRPNQLPKKVMSSLFPIYDQLGPFRYPGQEVPSQILHQNGVYQIVPVRPDFGFGNQEGNRDQNYPKQENHEPLKASQPKLQIEIPVPKQGYHAHPNGAISFASFSHNLPVNTQYETGPPTQQAQLQSQAIPVQQTPQIQPEVTLQSQEQKLTPVKQKLLNPSMLQRLIEDLQKYEPVYRQQPQFIPFKQLIQNQPRMLNALQQHLLFQEPRQLPNPQLIQLQRLPTFKPLPQSLLSAESVLQQTRRSPVISQRSPRPFSYEDHSTQNTENFDLPLEPASTQLTPLPPLKPNYSKYVKPLEPHPHTKPVFLPTQSQPLFTSTPKLLPVPDQLISSTTIQPNVKDQEDPKKQSIQKETQPQSQISQSLQPEITHQSQSTVRPAPIQSTTYLPFVTHEPQSIFFQYSTPQPVYQASIRPSSPRHDVVIQRQEIRELFFEPSPQPSSTPHNQNQHQIAYQQEQEVHQLRTQPHHQLFEQLQPLQFQHEMQDINSQQYQLKARQSKPPQKLDTSLQGEHLQYLIQQQLPLQLQHFQPKLLQTQQSELEQLQQQQLVYQTQQHGSQQAQQQASEQAQQQQQALEQAQQQQQASEQAQQQQQALEQAQQQQQASEQAQQQQQASEQAQQKASQQAQQQQQASEQAQQKASQQAQQQQQASEQAQQQQQHGSEQEQQEYQHHLDTNNQIQISTLKPTQDAEKQTETVEILQQPESQPQLQQQSNLQPTTGKPKEQPDNLSEPTPNAEQPYVAPLLTSSELPQIHALQRQLVAQPEYSPLLGVPSYSDVQYFGKFAETLFGNHRH